MHDINKKKLYNSTTLDILLVKVGFTRNDAAITSGKIFFLFLNNNKIKKKIRFNK